MHACSFRQITCSADLEAHITASNTADVQFRSSCIALYPIDPKTSWLLKLGTIKALLPCYAQVLSC